MKSVVKILGIAFIVALTLGACSKDKVSYGGATEDPQQNIGYLMLGDMVASVLEDTENIENDIAIENAANPVEKPEEKRESLASEEESF